MVNACAGERIQLPKFEEAERVDLGEVTEPTDYPLLCAIPWSSAACWQAVGVFEEVAEGNKTVAHLNAGIAADSEEAYDKILSAAKRQQGYAQIREDMYEQEKKNHMWTKIKHWGLIAVGILAYGASQ